MRDVSAREALLEFQMKFGRPEAVESSGVVEIVGVVLALVPQGYRLKGRTPAQALREALAVDTLPPIVPEQEVTSENEPDTLAA